MSQPATVRNFPSKSNPLPPIPPGELATQVLGHAASVENFLYGGFKVAEAIRRTLQWLGRPLDSFRDVLDFGCGSGRVLRWFAPYQNHCRFRGCDISREAIEWSRAHLPFAEFFENGMEPPLPFAGESFDLIYGVSVVTHIDEPLQFAWLRELGRVLRPGGIALLTVMGDALARWKLPAADFAAFQSKGHFYKHVQEGGLHGLPEFYQDAYHSGTYIFREWSRYFNPLAFIKNGLMHFQDSVILEASSRRGNPPEVRLAFGEIDQPRAADVITDKKLPICGWALDHHDVNLRINITLDGQEAGACAAIESTPVLAEALPVFPGAANAGFSTILDVSDLPPGPHVLEGWANQQPLPFLTTYFFTE